MKNIITLAFIFKILIIFPCTTFVIKSENDLVFGRNLDWVSENGIIVVNQRNQLKKSIVFSPDLPITWTSRFGSVTFNQFGKELPFGGINEKGLVIEIMVANAEYSDLDDRKAVNELQWIQYQLDNSSNLNDVIKNDELIRLSMISQELHFLVADKDGNVAVIEFKNGKMEVYKEDKLPFPVLENDVYEVSLKKYKNNKPCRFTTATDKVNNYSESQNISAIDYSFDILKDVALDGSWSIVYDIKNMTINFITKSNKKRKTIDLKTFNFSCNQETLIYDLKIDDEGEITDKFIQLTYKMNTTKMKDAMNKNRIMLPEEIKNLFYNYHETVKCNTN